jgi:hypothetical protein
MKWTDENIEDFIRDHKDEFEKYVYPEPNHEQHFLIKLINRFKKIISIVPYLVRVGIVTILIFSGSFFTWKNYICPPLTHVSLQYWKYEHVTRYKIHKDTRILWRDYVKTPEQKEDFKHKLKFADIGYDILKKEQGYRNAGGRFIVPIPKPQIV